MDVKAFFGIVAIAVSIAAYAPYFRSIFIGETKPHLYTWLVWTLTTSTGTAGLWYGGGGFAAVAATLNAALTLVCLLLCFHYGTKNVTLGDTAVLILCVCAIGAWWFFAQALLAVVLASLIDVAAYIPTYRKSWADPWSEAVLPWMVWILYGACIILALRNYNLLTLTFVLLTTILANVALVLILLLRRRAIRPR